MAAALPFIGTGLGIYSAIKGGQQQGAANKINQQQLAAYQAQQAQQDAIRRMILGRIQGSQGAIGNPFSVPYGKVGG